MIPYLENERAAIESKEHWKEWINKMPAFHFEPDWDVYVIPPFGGAMARFKIKKGSRWVSVYFDVFSRLGYMVDHENKPLPYFELYPWGNDIKRYYIDEVDELMQDIHTVLDGGYGG